MFFKKNLPVWERALRTLAGLAIIAFALTTGMQEWVKWLLVATGVSCIGMGFVGFCPMCAMFGRKLKEST